MSQLQSDRASHMLLEENEAVCKGPRRKREFIPAEKKDTIYWEKRRKNNEAAKRSREKRKVNDYVLETHLMALKEENARLSAELMAIKLNVGLVYPAAYPVHQPNHIQHYTRGSTATNMHQQFLHRDHYWSGRDSSIVPNHLQSSPAFIPTYALHSYFNFNTPSSTGSGLLTPFLLPQHLMPAHSSHPGAPLPKPIPARATAEEEQEQQVPGVLSHSCPAPPREITTRGDSNYSPFLEV